MRSWPEAVSLKNMFLARERNLKTNLAFREVEKNIFPWEQKGHLLCPECMLNLGWIWIFKSQTTSKLS